jgi:hypothetical protein
MLMPHYKIPAYGAGFLPATALISAVFLADIKKQCVKRMILILLAVIGIAQYIDFSYKTFDFFITIKISFCYDKNLTVSSQEQMSPRKRHKNLRK